ncbi:MAG: Ribosomal silencing factor RsfS [Alphaproteobacteria bacterium MarineAlpha9_Bin2]|nr:MAG: Ribosomal silencing factor RsfS [Alphaproteobacteria bacterium MarineAlpha9_Bin2]
MKINKISHKNKNDLILNTIVEQTLDVGKAENIVSISLNGKSSIADHMIIASGTSARHVSALANQLSRKLKKEGYTILSIQGQSEANWILVDAGDVIIHLFRPEVRDFYNLDKMWLTPQDGIEI